MDPDNPVSRVGRTFWTVWSLISEAVNRFLRPEPTNVASSDPNSLQESPDDSKPANCGHAEHDASRREVDEEQPLATVSLLSSSRPVIAWELCTTDIDLGPDEPNSGSEGKASEEGKGTREEQFVTTGKDDDESGLRVAKDAKEDEREENGNQKLYTHGRDETPESDEDEEHVNNRSRRLAGDAMNEDIEESGRKAGAVEETERAMTADDHQKMDETMKNIQVREEASEMHHEDKQDLEAEDIEVKLHHITDLSLEEEDNINIEEARVQSNEAGTAVTHEEEEDGDGDLLLASVNENKSDDAAKQDESQLAVREELSQDERDFKGDPAFSELQVEIQMAYDKSGIVSEDGLVVAGQEHVIAPRIESDIVEDEKEKEDESTVDEREQGAVIEEENVNEAANNQTMDEVPEQEDAIKTFTEESQEEDLLMEHVTCSEEVGQNEDQEDVAKDTDVQTKTRETDDVETESPHSGTVSDEKTDGTSTDISVAEERPSSEVDYRESSLEVACISTSEGETGQEISREFQNISLGICEGQLVVSQELNSPTCEETQEGVPEYNNEPGPNENITQRFLEVGNSEEIQATQLPEEVESKEPESLQNSGCSAGADCLLVREHMEEEQESAEDIKNSFDLVVKEHAELPKETEKPLVEPLIQESGLLFEEEEEELSVASMKTGIELSEKEFETLVSFTDETGKTTKELQGGTEELLFEFEIDEGLCDSQGADAAGDITESGFLSQSVETEPKVLEVSTVDMQDAGIDMDETGYGIGEEAAEDEMQNKNELETLNLQLVGMAAELSTERSEKENESALFRAVEALETEIKLSDEELEISNEDTEAADESMTTESRPKDLTIMSTEEMSKHVTESEGSNAEETISSISGHQDVIDEEILDLWMKTLSEDPDGIKQQEGLEPGQQVVTDIEPSNEEQDKISPVQTEKDEEKLVESEIVSDTEMSFSTREDGFSDQSLDEWGTQNSGTELLKSTSTGSFPSINDMVANISESEMSTQQQNNSESQDTLMEETAETMLSHLKDEESITETGFPPDSGVTSSEAIRPNQESDKTQEKTEEESGSQKEIDADVTEPAGKSDWKDSEEADVKSLTEMSVFSKVEETKVEEEELSVASMKTGIELSEKEFETLVSFTDETDKTTKELQGGTEELLFEFEIDEGLCDSQGADAAGDITESGFLSQLVETEPKVLEDSTVDMQDAGIDMDETGYGIGEEAAEDEMQNKNKLETLNLQLVEMAAELCTKRNEKENESELLIAVEALETEIKLSDEELEISNEDTEAADESMTTESKPKDLTIMSTEEMSKHVTESEGSNAEETISSISGHQDVIDEEILDLWMKTLSEDPDGIKQQEGLEPGQQVVTDIEPSNEEQNKISPVQTEKDEEKLVESEIVSDTEMSFSTREDGFSEQSLDEWGTQNSGTELLKSTSTGSFPSINDMVANISESEMSTQQQNNSESQDTLIEETAETMLSHLKDEESITETGFPPDSGVTSSEAIRPNQESDKTQEKTEEESGSQKEIDADVTEPAGKSDWKDSEEADVKSLTEMSVLSKVEETKVEDEPLEITVSDSPDEIKHTESGRTRSGSEASLEEGIVSTEPGSRDDTGTQPGWSEDIADSLPKLNRAEVAEHPTTKFKDHDEVDASALDFSAQKSRIAVKNPNVRPPKDPRSLLHMPSVDPTPSSRLPVKVPAGVPLGGMGIGIKLPGLGAGFPVLKKTQRVAKDENSPGTLSQEPKTKMEDKSDTPKQDEAQHKPKWMPPRHPGFGNPLMSELKTKLKKTTKE